MPLSSRFMIPGKVAPFHILSIEGMPKQGKTHLAATAPGVVAFQSLDFGTDGILQKFEDYASKFMVAEYRVNLDVTADAVMQQMAKVRGAKKDDLQAIAYKEAEEQALKVKREVWQPFVQDYDSLLDEESVRTIVWDTATEVNEMLRLANFGKLEKNPKIAYGPINAEFKAQIRKAQERRKNLILIHHMKPVYIESERGASTESGRYVLKGNSSLENLVHSYVKVSKKIDKGKAKFVTTIRDARLEPSATGRTINNADWPTLMMELMPNVDPKVWLGEE